MKIRFPLVLAIFSVIALLPATTFLVGGVIVFISAIMVIAQSPLFLFGSGFDFELLSFSFSYIAGAFAIWRCWVIVIRTVREEPVLFSKWTLIAFVCAVVSASEASLIGGIRVFIFVVLPVCILMGHILWLHYRRS